jgi:release factor glutamine methyltransferase
VSEAWTPLRLIAWTQEFFARSAVDAPRLTAEVLLAHALGCDRVRLYLDFDKPLAAAELSRFRELVKRRAGGEPTAYLVGAREFYGRRFAVDPRVLVPRPETELVVEAALAALPDGGSALDLCTGSGCVGVTLALERPSARVVAVDVSAGALAVARANAEALGARVELLEGDLYRASTSWSRTRPTCRRGSCRGSRARCAASRRSRSTAAPTGSRSRARSSPGRRATSRRGARW